MSRDSGPGESKTEDNRLALEIEKLRYEVRDMTPPEFRRSSFWFNVIAGIVAVGGMWLQWSSAMYDKSRAERAEAIAQEERKLAEDDRTESDALLDEAKKAIETSVVENDRHLKQLETQVRASGSLSAIDVTRFKSNLEAGVKPVQDLKARIERLPEKKGSRLKLRADAIEKVRR